MYRFDYRQVAALLTIFEAMAWSTRWFNRPSDFDDIDSFVGALHDALLDPQSPEIITLTPEFRIVDCHLQYRIIEIGGDWIDLGNVCGADGAPAPTPVVYIDPSTKTVDGQTVDGFLVQFDMDDNGTIDGQYATYDGFNGADGQPGAPAPTPQVDTPAVEGGHLVRFDMNDNGIWDDTFFVADGINGTPAPTPVVYIDPSTKTVGGQTVDGFLV